MSQKQRVGGFVVRTLYKIYQLLGYKFVYYSLYLVVAYYFLFAKNVKISLKLYYSRLGIPFSYKNYFRHLFNYAVATSDRFISKSDPQLYTFHNQNRPQLLKEIEEGSILLLNHFGGWATASNYFQYEGKKFHMVMNEAMLKSAKEFEEIIDKKNKEHINIIDLSNGMIQAYIEIANALLSNQSVALMGDRAISEKNEKKLDFFGEKANFNQNPFIIAHKTKKPIVIIFVILKEALQYEIVFKKIEPDISLSQEEAVDKAMDEYIEYLSDILKQYPLQWFNFYNFWEK